MKGYVQLVHCYYSIDHSDQTLLVHLVCQSYAIIVDNAILKWSRTLYAERYIEPSASKVEYKNRAPYIWNKLVEIMDALIVSVI